MPLEACARRDGSLLLLVPLALAGLIVCTTAQICIIKDCDADCDQMWVEARLRVLFTLKMAARFIFDTPSLRFLRCRRMLTIVHARTTQPLHARSSDSSDVCSRAVLGLCAQLIVSASAATDLLRSGLAAKRARRSGSRGPRFSPPPAAAA